ncbi:putative thiopurine S-methyltransferase [Saccoglossus kowalevskii]
MSANLGGIPAYWDKGLQMKASDWERVWEERKAVFEMPKVHRLADKGHDVVGVEYAKLPCREFFEEQRLESDTTPMEDVSGGFLHKSSDGKIKIFQCDFFKFKKSHAGNFDVIWDRASLVALNKSDRKK